MTKDERDKLADKFRRASDAYRLSSHGNIYEDGKAQGLMIAASMIGKIIPDETDLFGTEPEIRTGRWIDSDPDKADSSYRKDGMAYFCSVCKHRAGKYKHRTYRFCPWCGAKMEVENED